MEGLGQKMAYEIREFCLGCHYCALECPAGAINYKGTRYRIDKEACTECGVCAKVCNINAIDTGEREAVQKHELIERSADLVVIGAGAAGTVAAVKTAELTGAKVIVIEKAEKYGGSGWFAGFDIGNVDRRPPPPGASDISSAAEGSGAPPASGAGGDAPPPMSMRDMSYMEKFDKELVANARQAGKNLNDWLMGLDSVKPYLVEVELFGSRGFTLDDRRIWFNEKSTDNSIGPGKGGSFLIQTMVNMFGQYGIELYCRHAAKKILTDDNGAVCGVLADEPGGETLIRCRAVICAVGSYTHNDELLRRHVPWFFAGDDNPDSEPVHRFAAPTDTGDIVALGEGCGAYIDYENFCANVFGPVHHPFSFSLFSAQMNGDQITVNMNGRRFFDEGSMGAGAAPICSQPRRIAYTIYAEKALESVIENTIKSRGGAEAECLKRWRRDVQDEISSNNGISLFVADTIAELADKAGIDKAGLLNEVERYNGFCERGVDEDFGKAPRYLHALEEGPFYAIFGKMASDGAFGGVLVNPRCEVYGADRSGVIPGLYAAGDNASGVQANPGVPGDIRQKAFSDFAWAVNGAYLTAGSCAEFLNMSQCGK